MKKLSFLLPVLLCVRLLCASQMINAGSDTSAPSWMRNAIIYGIKPSGFVSNSTYDNIKDKLPELKELGINTIWLLPVFKTKQGGQGYDVTDYFSLREDLGTAEQLKNLVNSAHDLHMRVLFDFVPNHTSIEHPFAKDIILNGPASKWYDYYQHEKDGAPYSSYYHIDSNRFTYYFWKNLVNLNYNNSEVKKMIIDACTYWVKEFDIDGYRFDAVWAVNARAPAFGMELRTALKTIKPDILLLAEDKGSDPDVYKKGFDAAYDWTTDTNWVSHWPWQYEHHERKNFTVFNHPDVAKRFALLREALFANEHNNDRILRFMENNDLPRFINAHSLKQTKMAAAILFALPGIPLLFNGQETGVATHPYSRRPVFYADKSIREVDSFALFDHYRNLISKRLQHRSLTGKYMKEIKVMNPEQAIAFHRWEGNEHFIIVINPDSIPHTCQLYIDNQGIRKRKGYFHDILNEENFENNSGASLLTVPMDGYSVRWLTPRKKQGNRKVTTDNSKNQ